MTDSLAIVGSRAFADPALCTDDERLRAYRLIQSVIERDEPGVIVSGGADGIDSMATEVALGLGYALAEDLAWLDLTTKRVKEFLPTVRNWPAYRTRDIDIARHATKLVCIRHPKSTTYGSGWTADYAQREIGIPVERYVLS